MEGGIAVSEQQSGLRFDIYERVHLPQEVPAIRELDEIELTPQIRVAVEGEQAVIKGSLLLSGVYAELTDGDTRSTKTLEHTIPVEITLPMSRIRSVDDISVEIDNFDVDLLSERSLNVTGVLSLNGIEIVSGQAEPWRNEEEVVFVHEAQPEAHPRPEEPKPEAYAAPWLSNQPASRKEPQPAEETPAPSAPPQTAQTPSPFFQTAPAQAAPSSAAADVVRVEEPPKRPEFAEEAHEELESSAPFEAVPASAAAGEEEHEASGADLVVTAEPEKGEMKIAFGSKPDVHSFDFKPHIGKTDEYRSQQPAAAPAGSGRAAAESESAEPKSGSDLLEWKNLFLSADEEQQFRRVRLCIVHKDDTVESIAKKYDRKPQEIRLYNRLADQEVSEGQVLYIP